MRAPADFAQLFGAWMSTVRDWLAAWSGQMRSPALLKPPPTIRAALFDEPEGEPVSGGGAREVIVIGERACSSTELRAAFAAASRDEDVPLQWQLFAEAKVYAVRQQYRQAVISACGAAEVTLSEGAREALVRAGRSEKEVKEVLRGLTGVVELYRMNAGRRDGLSVSIGQVIDQLARPRNLAAHAGERLDADTASKAMRTTRALMEVSPLPTPRSLLKGPTHTQHRN